MNALIAVILGAITVYLTYTRYARRMGQAQERLTDEQKTAFFFVTLPEALPIAVISRFIGWFQDFGIPVGGVIGSVRALVSLFDQEVRGCAMLREAAQKLMT
jgi:anion-transporting  ArsA/GET3 family ATPase